MRITMVTILWAAAVALAPACKSNERAPASSATAAPSPSKPAPRAAPEPGAATATLSDARIAAIVVAANQVDVDAGKLAAGQTRNAEVKRFAEQMVTDHSAVNQAAVELVTKLEVAPEESDVSRGLVSSGAETRARLASLEGEAFDRAYVDNEVAYHQAVIGVLDAQLIPSATDEELKQLLVAVRPALVAHLQHAQHLQASLAVGPAGK